MTRNLAYYHAGMELADMKGRCDFWRTLIGNCIDTAVLEWCKIFGDKKAKQSIYKVVENPGEVFVAMFSDIGVSEKDFVECQTELRTYRDKFIAHLDSEETMNVPTMDKPHRMVDYLYNYLKNNNEPSLFIGLPNDMSGYWCSLNEEARAKFNLTT
jgi:hypothetical protein